MTSRNVGRRRGVVALVTGTALAGSLLGSLAAVAQAPEPAAAAPAAAVGAAPPLSATSLNLLAAPLPRGRPRVPSGSLNTEQEKAGLRPDTPRYFTRIFHSILQAPMPPQIFEQGGIPANVPQHEVDADPTGRISSFQPLGSTPTANNAFFQSLGENGRSCVTCHLPANAMSVSVDNVNARWNISSGTDPIFAPIDGSDCPNKVAQASQGSLDPRSAHQLLLNRGLFRIFLSVPDNAEYTVQVVNDPTDSAPTPPFFNPTAPLPVFNNDGCNSSAAFNIGKDLKTGNPVHILSMYRRPRIAANLPYVTTTRDDLGVNPPVAIDPITKLPIAIGDPPVTIDPRTGRPVTGNIMWDGREPTLEHQASDATQGHAQAPFPPTSTQIAEMVQFENGIFSAQSWDAWTHLLTADGALSGPVYLTDGTPGLPALTIPVTTPPAPPPPTLPAATTASFPLFDNWSTLAATAERAAERASVARGQTIFQTRLFVIDGVAGLTNIGTVKPSTAGTCSSCHNQANTGNDSFPAAQHDIGIGGTTGVPIPTGAPTTVPLPSTQLPIFKLTCKTGKSTVYQGSVVVTNDPGLAITTGLCADIGRLTVPQLRGLAARAPYFSDGSAATLLDVVTFYNNRFNIALTGQDELDLVAFLRSL